MSWPTILSLAQRATHPYGRSVSCRPFLTGTVASWSCASSRRASIKEAAKVMNLTVGNAKVLQHRALRMATRVASGLEQ